jgi:hypothetical protein
MTMKSTMTDQQRDPIHTNKTIRRTVCTSYAGDAQSWECSTPVVTAPVFVYEDDVTVNIQIELNDDHAMLISVRKDGAEPRLPVLTLWRDRGEHDLPPERWHTLRAWFADVIAGRDPLECRNNPIRHRRNGLLLLSSRTVLSRV